MSSMKRSQISGLMGAVESSCVFKPAHKDGGIWRGISTTYWSTGDLFIMFFVECEVIGFEG